MRTQDGLIECPLLFFFVKKKRCAGMQIGTPLMVNDVRVILVFGGGMSESLCEISADICSGS